MTEAVVYTVRCVPTGHVYVGVTRSPERRRQQHMGKLRAGSHSCRELQRLYCEHGPTAFTWQVVERVPIFCGGQVMAAIIADAENRWRHRLRSESPGFVIGSKASFNQWIDFPGWDHETDDFARGIFTPEPDKHWKLVG